MNDIDIFTCIVWESLKMAYLSDAFPMYFLKESAVPMITTMIMMRTTTVATVMIAGTVEELRDLLFSVGSFGNPNPT